MAFLVATFTLPAPGVFQRGFVLWALPATSCACVTLALGCGLALLAAPSLVTSLRRTHPTGTADTS